MEWTAWSHAEHSSPGVEQIEEREEIVFVGAATVEEDEETLGLGGGRSRQVAEGVRGHGRGRYLGAGSADLLG